MKELPTAVTARHTLIVQWLADEGRLDVLHAGRPARRGPGDGPSGPAGAGVRRPPAARARRRRPGRSRSLPGRRAGLGGQTARCRAGPTAVGRAPPDGTLLLGAGPLTLALVAEIADDPPPAGASPSCPTRWTRPSPRPDPQRWPSTTSAARSRRPPGPRRATGRCRSWPGCRSTSALVCPAGISVDRGLGQPTPAAAAVSQAEVGCGQNVIVLAERSSWVARRSSSSRPGRRSTLMLSGRPDEAASAPFRRRGVDVVVVEADDDAGAALAIDRRSWMSFVAGVDSSTQSVKVVVCDAESGRVIRTARAAHPHGTEVSAEAWWTAYRRGDGGPRAAATGWRPSPSAASSTAWSPWTSRASWSATPCSGTTTGRRRDADDLIAELGGPQAWADAVGTVPVASMTVSKIRWLASRGAGERGPDARGGPAARLAHLADRRRDLRRSPPIAATPPAPATSTRTRNEYRMDLVRRAIGHDARPPPRRRAGRDRRPHRRTGIAIAPGTGDNMAAGLALGLQPGDAVVSLGTSGTAYTAARTRPTSRRAPWPASPTPPAVPAAGLHPERRPQPGGDRRAARGQPGRAQPARAQRTRRQRWAGLHALPRRRADAAAARRAGAS